MKQVVPNDIAVSAYTIYLYHSFDDFIVKLLQVQKSKLQVQMNQLRCAWLLLIQKLFVNEATRGLDLIGRSPRLQCANRINVANHLARELEARYDLHCSFRRQTTDCRFHTFEKLTERL